MQKSRNQRTEIPRPETYVRRLVEKGADIETGRDFLGHYSITVTQRYTHSNEDRKRKAVELLGCDVCVTHGRI
jgi:integrase